jgi:voltage-gated potassium channel
MTIFSRTLHIKNFNTFFNILTVFAILSLIISMEFKSMRSYSAYILTEIIFAFLFGVEYFIRIFGSKHPLKETIKPLMIIDLISLISFIFMKNFSHLRILRFLKIFSIFRSKRYKIAVITITKVFKNEKEAILVIMVLFLMLLFISSTLMYLFEHNYQNSFKTIFKALWWAIITATSVGYGDVVPITSFGKILAGFTAIIGILLYSMMTAIFATGFAKELRKIKSKNDNTL